MDSISANFALKIKLLDGQTLVIQVSKNTLVHDILQVCYNNSNHYSCFHLQFQNKKLQPLQTLEEIPNIVADTSEFIAVACM
jgi:hypothetical protein